MSDLAVVQCFLQAVFGSLLPTVRVYRDENYKSSQWQQIRSGRVGCAYYDPVECILYVMEDTQDSGHYDLTRMSTEFAV
jgi:hypothetical protein